MHRAAAYTLTRLWSHLIMLLSQRLMLVSAIEGTRCCDFGSKEVARLAHRRMVAGKANNGIIVLSTAALL